MTDVTDYGRYAGGRSVGYLQTTTTAPPPEAALIASAAAFRAAIQTAAQAVQAAIAGLGAVTSTADIAAAVQAHVASLAAACTDPATRVRLLSALAAQQLGPATPAAAAISTLYRLAAVSQLAQAGAAYAPSSYDDAVATRGTITAAIDAAMDQAGDAGADDVFAALRTLRAYVVADLTQRGASLPRLSAFETATPLPDVALAMRRYGTPDRAAELVTEGDPPHPLFMPTSFLALAS